MGLWSWLSSDEDSSEEESERVEPGSGLPGDPEKYAIDLEPGSGRSQMGLEIDCYTPDGDGPYLGEWGRKMIEMAQYDPTQATWIGYSSSTRTGLREIPIAHKSWFRHAGVFGTTGYGKTTLLKMLMVQWAYAGWGFCFIDPKGDGVEELMQELPENRLDDVIWIDPAPLNSDQVVGINFLEPGQVENEQQFEAEVESILDDLKNIVKNESYWGPKMDGIFSNFARGMINSEKPYTLIDMYYVMLDERYRNLFAAEVDDPAVRRYTTVIAEEMDQSDLDPLLRRLQKMVENRVTREIVAHRYASVNLKNAVEDGKIILVKNDIDSEDVKRMVATGIMRRVWAAIKARTAQREEARTPFFMIIDEFDDVVSEDANVDKMLSKARSMRMSVTLCCQQPSQLPQKIVKAIFGNCDNLLAMNPNEPDDAKLIMKRFDDRTDQELINLGRFKMFTRIMVDTDRSKPFITKTFPDYPPLRTEAEAHEAIEKSLERYGRPRLDPTEAVNDVIIGRDNWRDDIPEHAQKRFHMEAKEASVDEAEQGGGQTASAGGESEEATATATATASATGGDEEASDDSPTDDSVSNRLDYSATTEGSGDAEAEGRDIPEDTLLESIWAVEVRDYKEGDWLPIKEVTDELARRVEGEKYQSVSANAFEILPRKYHEGIETRNGDPSIKLKQAARAKVLQQDTGSGATGGGMGHRIALQQSFETFTKGGFIVTFPTQGGDALPDGIAKLPFDTRSKNYHEAQKMMRQLQKEWPDAAELSNGAHLNIEAETTTHQKPKQTLKNLKKAQVKGRRCIFLVKDQTAGEGTIGHDAERVASILTDPPCVSKQDSKGNRQFYNNSKRMEVSDGTYAVRKKSTGTRGVWRENGDEIGLYATDVNGPLCTFSSADEVMHAGRGDVPAHYTYDQSAGIIIVESNMEDGETKTIEYNDRDDFKSDWTVIRPPFIPEYEFNGLPEQEDWLIGIVPDSDAELPLLEYNFEGFDGDGNIVGEIRPLLPSLRKDFHIERIAPRVSPKEAHLLRGYDGPVGENYSMVKQREERDAEDEAEEEANGSETPSTDASTTNADDSATDESPTPEEEPQPAESGSSPPRDDGGVDDEDAHTEDTVADDEGAEEDSERVDVPDSIGSSSDEDDSTSTGSGSASEPEPDPVPRDTEGGADDETESSVTVHKPDVIEELGAGAEETVEDSAEASIVDSDDDPDSVDEEPVAPSEEGVEAEVEADIERDEPEEEPMEIDLDPDSESESPAGAETSTTAPEDDSTSTGDNSGSVGGNWQIATITGTFQTEDHAVNMDEERNQKPKQLDGEAKVYTLCNQQAPQGESRHKISVDDLTCTECERRIKAVADGDTTPEEEKSEQEQSEKELKDEWRGAMEVEKRQSEREDAESD